MLLWLQRSYLSERFPNYDPSADRDEETPYDLDHIQPQASWGANWQTQSKRLSKTSDVERFRNGRDYLGNAIGNLRWIGSSENRSDGDLGLREKLALNPPGKIVPDPEANDTRSEPDWRLGIFDGNQRNLWYAAGADKEDSDWSEERIQSFQEAVELRTVWLYRQWWEQASFDTWIS